ncbi:MAG: FecR domain-containing protein [Gemmatimonadota bacterium]
MSIHDEPLPGILGAEEDRSELKQTWRLLEEPEPVPTAATDAAWLDLTRRLADVETPEDVEGEVGTTHPRSDRPRRTRGPFLQVAAAILVSLGGTGVWYSTPVVHTAAAGSNETVELADGSRVLLNAGSELRSRRGFSLLPGVPASTRRVELDGEAFFDVASDGRAFEVVTAGARVHVLGTRFNVRARDGEGSSVRVTVEEGSVAVESEGTSGRAVLEAGESVRVGPTGVLEEVSDVPSSRIAPWRNGGITLVDEPLSGIVRELSVRLDVSIRVAAEAAPGATMNVFYSRLDSIESVLADLATQQGLRYRQTAEGWELF